MPSPAVRQQITEEDVRKFVLPGTPRDTIINRFGEPISEDKNPVFEDHSTDVDTILYFDFGPPQKGKEENYAFCGFEVFLKNGKAVKWSAIHRSVSRH